MKTPFSNFKRLFKPSSPEVVDSIVSLQLHRELVCTFQPIVNLRTGGISGHEAFVRKAKNESLTKVPTTNNAGKQLRMQGNFELACVDCAVEGWAHHFRHGQLFVNISAKSLVHLEAQPEAGRLINALTCHGVPPECIVFEITEHGRFAGVQDLVHAANKLRATGASIAMDDVKGSEGSLKMWFRLSPEVVKLDERLTNGVSENDEKSKAIRTLVALAAKYGCTLVAKSVETAKDLCALRDLGVDFAQGYFLGSPDAVPTEALNLRARDVISQDWQEGNSRADYSVA